MFCGARFLFRCAAAYQLRLKKVGIALDASHMVTSGGIQELLSDEDGATAVEYGLILAAISALIIAVVMSLGAKMKNAFNNVQSRI